MNGYQRSEPVHICGLATTPWAVEHNAVLDELVFDCVSRALRQAGLRKQQVGLVVLASMDVYDGRSISTGLTTPAAGGYLTDSYRIEGDSAQAIIAAAQAVRSGHADVAVAAAVHHPEIHSPSSAAHLAFLEQMSNLAFDPQFNRPVAMTASAGFALQASAWLEQQGGDASVLAARAAAEISRGAGRSSVVRNSPLDAEQVLASAPIAWPLTELMLPAYTGGAGAVVLASPQVARRARGSRARLLGTGTATADWTWSESWLATPAAAAGRAAVEAYAHAGHAGSQAGVDVVELTAATPALVDPLCAALGVDPTGEAAVCPFGGARTTFPGLANGIWRLSEAIEWLEHRPGSGRGVVHSTEMVSGPFSETSSVLVVEAA